MKRQITGAVVSEFPLGRTTKPRKHTKEMGNIEDDVALDFAGRHADDLRYVARWNRWMQWDGDRWRQEHTLRAFDMARTLCREAADAKAKTVAAVVTLARSDRAIAGTEQQWDVDLALFNTPTRRLRK